MTLEDSIHSQRLHVLREAERLGNVTGQALALGHLTCPALFGPAEA